MNVAFLGLGAMGTRMVTHLIRAEHRVVVWNRDPGKAAALVPHGAQVARTPREAVIGVDAVVTMVRDDDASRTVWCDPAFGALHAMPADALAIDCSTLTIGWAREWATRAADRGVHALDAPVVGSRPQADAAQLVFLAGGVSHVVDQATPLLRAMGSTVHHCGEHGSGAAVKLAVNALYSVQVAVIAELLGVLAGHGVDAARALDIIGTLPASSAALKVAGASMLAGQFAAQFPVDLVEKDLGYVDVAARTVGGSAPVAAAARDVMRDAIARGWGAENLTAVAKLYR